MLPPSFLGISFHFVSPELSAGVTFVDTTVTVKLQHASLKQSPVRAAPIILCCVLP